MIGTETWIARKGQLDEENKRKALEDALKAKGLGARTDGKFRGFLIRLVHPRHRGLVGG